MLERELTTQNGLIAKSLPQGWFWIRISDLPHGHRRSVGFDGILCRGEYAYMVEVKIGWAVLSESELKVMHKFNKVGIKYLILRYFEEYEYKEYFYSWVCEGINDKAVTGDLKYICKVLEGL